MFSIVYLEFRLSIVDSESWRLLTVHHFGFSPNPLSAPDTWYPAVPNLSIVRYQVAFLIQLSIMIDAESIY